MKKSKIKIFFTLLLASVMFVLSVSKILAGCFRDEAKYIELISRTSGSECLELNGNGYGRCAPCSISNSYYATNKCDDSLILDLGNGEEFEFISVKGLKERELEKMIEYSEIYGQYRLPDYDVNYAFKWCEPSIESEDFAVEVGRCMVENNKIREQYLTRVGIKFDLNFHYKNNKDKKIILKFEIKEDKEIRKMILRQEKIDNLKELSIIIIPIIFFILWLRKIIIILKTKK